jgi:hypothetical protein
MPSTSQQEPMPSTSQQEPMPSTSQQEPMPSKRSTIRKYPSTSETQTNKECKARHNASTKKTWKQNRYKDRTHKRLSNLDNILEEPDGADQPTKIIADQPTKIIADQPSEIIADQPSEIIAWNVCGKKLDEVDEVDEVDQPDPSISTGVLHFDKEKGRCYILQDETGYRIPTSSVFEFLNGFISLGKLREIIEDEYTIEDQNEINVLIASWKEEEITIEVFYSEMSSRFS